MSLRARLFVALASSVLLGALITGLYAIYVDVRTIGFVPRLSSVAPKALVLAIVLLVVAAAGAAIVGRWLARPVEQLADAAGRIADGQQWTDLPSGSGGEARSIARALTTLRGEAARAPYAGAFLRDAWHDLKTPLAAIRATVEVLEDGAVEDPAAARRFVANLSRAAAELDRMLTDLVTLARMETATLEGEQAASVSAMIAGAVDSVAPLAAARGVAVSAGPDDARAEGANVRCDASAITRALSNLLENAVDATPGGEVRVSVDAGAHGRGSLFVDVVNEPAQVAREVRGRLFERAVHGARGSGLGLAIARAAIEAHGGRVRFVELGPPRVRVRIELPR